MVLATCLEHWHIKALRLGVNMPQAGRRSGQCSREATRVRLVQDVCHDTVLVLGAHCHNCCHEVGPVCDPSCWIVHGCAVCVQMVVNEHIEAIVHQHLCAGKRCSRSTRSTDELDCLSNPLTNYFNTFLEYSSKTSKKGCTTYAKELNLAICRTSA